MRSKSLQKPVLLTALGCLVLSGCGRLNASADQTPAGSAVSATARRDALSDSSDPEIRFLALLGRVMDTCAPDSSRGADGGVPEPEDLPGAEEESTPRYGPGETPPGTPNEEGDIPVPLDDPAPATTSPDSTRRGPVKEVPLTGIDKCMGGEHAQRVREAFENARTTGYQAMREKLMGLDYPASRIHRMPDRAGAPRARLDLRFMGNQLALEVTLTDGGVDVEPFGAPETDDVKVAEVQRKADDR
ncbi:hypothetical protein [Streptomyces siamensis]